MEIGVYTFAETTPDPASGHRIFGHQRFLAQMSVGTMPHAGVMKSIELLGTAVAPVGRRELGSTPPTGLSAGVSPMRK